MTQCCVCNVSRSQRKQQKDLLAALQKVVVPIYCTSFLAVEEEKQQKITRVNTSTSFQVKHSRTDSLMWWFVRSSQQCCSLILSNISILVYFWWIRTLFFCSPFTKLETWESNLVSVSLSLHSCYSFGRRMAILMKRPFSSSRIQHWALVSTRWVERAPPSYSVCCAGAWFSLW